MLVLSSGPDWASILTAFGTVGAVIVALGLAVWSERRTDRRLADERKHSDKQLADERAFSRAQLEEERRAASEREQVAEAYAVQVVMGEQSTGELGKRAAAPARAVVIMINHGRYTITGIEVRLRLAGGGNPNLIPLTERLLVPGARDPDAGLIAGLLARLEVRPGQVYADRLTPWDPGVQFQSDPVAVAQLPGAYPVVRWVDRWGTHWEHRRWEARQIEDGEEWVP